MISRAAKAEETTRTGTLPNRSNISCPYFLASEWRERPRSIFRPKPIFNLSAKAARENGEEVVRLEHFALIVITWKLQKDRPSKMAMEAKTCPANVGIIGVAELLEALKVAVAEPRVKTGGPMASSVYQKDVMMKIMSKCCVGGWMHR
ncbi:hypothetical protein RHGRI_009194 [Rhododendron griersonianum]|uniref:Uncharacterized protein n=1 Tax=Rhododendron griersonianum TaxID=479676 RepID=A0AAV6L4E2_9ERIC|nr:hypothetical protein RHGRI_009194 [Rhododendron griersonianum]